MSTENEFTVAIYASEYKQICAWVLRNHTLETGGDLFGLWFDDHTAVVQLVVGPGKNCQRTALSFYQDVEYLEKVGSNLTSKEGVCHIGEWHSHHTIGLEQPSGGDQQTVWTNMPQYKLRRFILFIANIEPKDEHGVNGVSVGCFLFEETGTNHKMLQGNFNLLPKESPFRSKCLKILQEGAEYMNENEEIDSMTEISQTSSRRKHIERPLMFYRPRKSSCCSLM